MWVSAGCHSLKASSDALHNAHRAASKWSRCYTIPRSMPSRRALWDHRSQCRPSPTAKCERQLAAERPMSSSSCLPPGWPGSPPGSSRVRSRLHKIGHCRCKPARFAIGRRVHSCTAAQRHPLSTWAARHRAPVAPSRLPVVKLV